MANVQIPVGARFVGIPDTESAENPSGVMVGIDVHHGTFIGDAGPTECFGDTSTISKCIRT